MNYNKFERGFSMKAFGAYNNEISSITEFEKDLPMLRAHDLLIQVDAISVNPVDTKVRQGIQEGLDSPKILGYDGYGRVVKTGTETHLFNIGDLVYWAGDVTREGSNSEFQAVDERIVGNAPSKLSVEKAVAMPLTSLTAYELIFEKLAVSTEEVDAGKTILIINGAGGVGSIAIQLARKIAGLKVIATASSPDSIAWVKKMGADYVINHHEDLPKQLASLGLDSVDYILILNAVNQHIDAATRLIAPQGKIANIVEPGRPINLDRLAHKSASFSFEWMFTKAVSQTADIESQHRILDQISAWLDEGIIESTFTQNVGELTAKNLQKAHQIIEDGHSIGKLVLVNRKN